jgi:hypothetical protein
VIKSGYLDMLFRGGLYQHTSVEEKMAELVERREDWKGDGGEGNGDGRGRWIYL